MKASTEFPYHPLCPGLKSLQWTHQPSSWAAWTQQVTEERSFGRQSRLGTKTCWAGIKPGCQRSVSTHFVSCAAAADAVGWVAKKDPRAGDTGKLSCRVRPPPVLMAWLAYCFLYLQAWGREVSHPWQGCEKPVLDLWINQSPFLSTVTISKHLAWAGKPSGYQLFYK